jgi:hypothetical protein
MADLNNKRPMHTEADWRVLTAILQKANGGDQKAIEALRNFLDENPQVWKQAGNLARIAEKAWIVAIANNDALGAEAIKRELAHIKQELIGENPSVVEELLGDQVLATLLEVKYLESVSAESKGSQVTQATLLLKRLDSAQKRHLNAIKSLIQVRKLLPNEDSTPGLRIYVGERKAA